MTSAQQVFAEEQGKTLDTVFTSNPPQIDGVLDDPAWRDAPLINSFHQVEPVEYAPPSELTEVRVLYDREYLYVAGRMHYSDIDMLTANAMTPRQRVWQDDRLYIMLDPFQDRRNGYLFEANANGIQGDALLENNNQRINDWSGVWQVETSIDEQGWSVEFRIPFATISFDPQQADWGFNVFRDIKFTQERLAWSSQGRQQLISAPSAGGTLKGLQGIKSGIGLDLIPSVSLRSTRDFETGVDQSEFEPSLDVTYRVTPSLTAKLTLNTDFSATEVDDRQVNLTRFSLFFPEKRNFFLQDAGIFEFAGLRFNGRPFFSRTIGLTSEGEPLNLNAGAKVTGRVGGWNLGFLGVQQESSAELDRRNLFVGRAAYNLFEESSIGLLMTDGDPLNQRSARTTGIDFRYRNSSFREDSVIQAELWYQRTDNDPVDENTGTDDEAWGAHFRLPNDRHNFGTWLYRFGEDFDPAMGFVNRTGIRDFFIFYQFRNRPEEGYWRFHARQFEFRTIKSLTDREVSQTIEFLPWIAQSRKSDEINFYIKREKEVLTEGFDLFDRIDVPAGDYEYTRYGTRLESADHRKLQFEMNIETGDFLGGTRDRFAVEVEWQPITNFNIEANYSSNRVKLPTGEFTARVLSLKSEMAFNNQWSLIPLFQFDNVSEELGINLRLRFHPSRGSDLYLVWSRNMLRDLDDRFQSTFQDSVVKGTYTFRF